MPSSGGGRGSPRLLVCGGGLHRRELVQPPNRVVEVFGLGDGEPHVVAERLAQLVRAAVPGWVGDGDEQQVVAEEADRQGLERKASSFWSRAAAS